MCDVAMESVLAERGGKAKKPPEQSGSGWQRREGFEGMHSRGRHACGSASVAFLYMLCLPTDA